MLVGDIDFIALHDQLFLVLGRFQVLQLVHLNRESSFGRLL